jgi:hypothetical protein
MLGRLLGRRARPIYLAVLLLPIVFSVSLRVRTFLAARKIHAVLSGLEQVRVDRTTEEQLLRTVPYLVPSDPTRQMLAGGHDSYRVEISNADYYYGWTRWVPDYVLSLWPVHDSDLPVKDKWKSLTFPLKAAYVLGWRHLSFSAYVTVLNGTVSSTGYNLEPDVLIGYPLSYFVVARSAHGFSRDAGRRPVPVHSTDDESPDYRFGAVAGQFSMLDGTDSSIGVAYTADAPRDLIDHAFRVDLGCFWGSRGCDSVHQVVPLLWKDRRAIEDATTARFRSTDPCPNRILSGRVRYLPDLNVALLEVVRSRSEEVNYEGNRSEDIVTDYRLKEAIRGNPEGPWTDIRHRWTIPWPLSPRGEIPNPEPPSYPKPGDRFLYFSGATFDSCRIIRATPSAESAVRSAIPAPSSPCQNAQFRQWPNFDELDRRFVSG